MTAPSHAKRPSFARPSAFAAGAALALSLTALPSQAGGSGENALLIVDPSNPESLYVANYYKAKRNIPDSNVIYMQPGAFNYQEQAAVNIPAFLSALDTRLIADHIDYVIIPSGGSFFVPANGMVSDSCVAVHRFATPSGYTLATRSADILDGIQSTRNNHFAKSNWQPHYFDSSTGWFGGDPSTAANAEHYFIGASLGYTGDLGNTLTEVLDMIDRSVAADGTHPAGTFYFMETTDPARSGPRHGLYPAAVTNLTAAGAAAEHLLAVLPDARHDILGIMTGWASPAIETTNMTILPGAFCDHLTSFAATFTTSSQVKMSRWITKGASATSGAVEEPCNYSGKFPTARLHKLYHDGLTVGESWFRSHGFYPFQSLFMGDPLTRPWSAEPTVDVADAPTAPVSGTIVLTPTVNAMAPGAGIAAVELHVDGRLQATTTGGAFVLDTLNFSDGWHDLRVIALDDTLVRHSGRWTGSIEIDNDGKAVSLSVAAATGDLATSFSFTVNASATAGSTVIQELLLMQNERVIASTTSASTTLSVFGQNLGAGPTSVQAIALFDDGRSARSAPVSLDIDYSGTTASTTPVAYGYSRSILFDQHHLIELPASYDDDLGLATYTIVQAPTQATLLPGSTGPYQTLLPDPGATGTDTLIFHVTTPGGQSGDVTIALTYTGIPETYCQTSPNSVGAGALIDSFGSLSLSENDLVLSTSGLPASQFGIYYYGSDQVQLPFGDGFRCVAGGIHRLPVQVVDGFGFAFHSLDYDNPPSPAGRIRAGDTWNFQFWYRDPAGGPAAFNLSNGLSATFVP